MHPLISALRDGSRIERALVLILEEIYRMSRQLDNLRAAVAELTTVDQSAIALLQGLSAKIAALAPDEDAIAQLALDVHNQAGALAAAVAANTPVEPAPAPAPAPIPAPVPAPLPEPTPEPAPAPVEP